MYQCDIQTNTLTFGFLGQPKILKDNRLPSSPFDMDDDFIEDYNPDTYIIYYCQLLDVCQSFNQ